MYVVRNGEHRDAAAGAWIAWRQKSPMEFPLIDYRSIIFVYASGGSHLVFQH